jgi:tetratricopeptide (TPR) repeat protein
MPNKAKVKIRPRPTAKAGVKTVARLSKTVDKSGRRPLKPSVRSGPDSRGTKAASPKISKESPRPRVPARPSSSKPAPTGKASAPVLQKPQIQPISGALKALETGIKLMYAEQYDKAIKCFHALMADFPDEVEVQASVRANIQACEKKMNDRARTVIRSSDDHYHMAVAFLNGGQVDSAMNHLQQALKLEPKGSHILYAIAAANALKGNKEQALSFLKQSIHHGPENRFHAAQDNDFANLVEEPAFRELLTTPGK